VIVNNSTNINKANNHLSPQTIDCLIQVWMIRDTVKLAIKIT